MKSNQNAPENKEFHLQDGRVLKNVKELLEALQGMSDEVFNHHVNAERNDFANWVRDVFGAKPLATQMKRVKTKDSTVKKIKQAIVAELKSSASGKKKPAAKKTAKKTTKKSSKTRKK